MAGIKDTYTAKLSSVLQPLEEPLQKQLSEYLSGVKRIDRISARAKAIDSFVKKAAKKNADGTDKYDQPLEQIQDQLGARIIVYYESDVAKVSEIIERYYRKIEIQSIFLESEWEFGYFGKHYILALQRDTIPEGIEERDAPKFFELQIKTLFQHAWSEAEHDLGYKSKIELSGDQQRLLAFTSAQSWGADRAFEELLSEVNSQITN